MEKKSKIFVAGGRGLVGSAIIRSLESQEFSNIVYPLSSEVDLRNQQQVADFFINEKPEYVFLAAAKVGGIYANNTYSGEFLYDNLMIEANVIDTAYRQGVKKLLFLGSSCIYPKFAPQPLKEEYLLTGELEPTNEPYAIAKIAGIKLCQAYRKQYGVDFISAMPTNLYGINDNFNLENSHVLPALMRKFHEAKVVNAPSVIVWGTGTPRREFMFVDDLADACVFLMQKYSDAEIVNIGTGSDLTIAEVAQMMAEVVGYTGKIVYDQTKPDGTPVKCLDVSKMDKMGWGAKIGLKEGLAFTYKWYLSRHF